MTGNVVTIVKDGNLIKVDETNLRKGDLVVVQTGDIVPADLQLFEERGLVVDDFDITGEIQPVYKQVNDEAVNLFMGSKVIKGMGRGIVIATGEESEYGQILKQKQELISPRPAPIFQPRYFLLIILLLPAFGVHLIGSQATLWLIAFYALWAVGLILLQNDLLFQYVFVRREIQRLSRLGIHISDPAVFEQMGSMDILCFDKTGVLTTRDLKVRQLHLADTVVNTERKIEDQIEKSTFEQLRTACALSHDVLLFEKIDQADPVDRAIIAFAEEQGVDLPDLWAKYERIYDVPFESENRSMVCGYQKNGRAVYYIKGDPDVVLHHCKDYLIAGGERKKVDAVFWRFSASAMDEITKKGDKAIALAYTSDLPDHAERPYTFLCLIQLENPLQTGARTVVEELKRNGIRPLLLTGDRPSAAISVGQACGISERSQAFLTGKVIDSVSSTEIARQTRYCSFYARLVPSQKAYLILLLKQRGHLVGMVGDGPNDGIALRVADVGISFTKNSSLIARRLSKILLSELVDLMALMEGAYRVQRRTKVLKAFRLLILVGSLVGAYIWTLSGLW